MERELRARNIDVAIAPTAEIISAADVDVETLFDDRQVVMAVPQNKWFRRRNITLADLVHEPWILPPADSVIRASIIEVFRTSGLAPPRNHVVTFSITLCYQLMASGRFLAMLPLSMARSHGGLPLKILDVGLRGIPRPTGIITLKKRTPNPLARVFTSSVRELAKPLARGR